MVQAWSMGSAQKSFDDVKQKKTVPGPGAYSPEKTKIAEKSLPEWVIGKSQRKTFETNKTLPGPGYYNIPEKIVEGPKFVMGMKTQSTENLLKAKDVPGPGQYSPLQNAFSTIGFSMGKKISGSITSRDGPGPGSYQTKSLFNQMKGPVSFGNNRRFNLDANGNLITKSMQEIPGPGAYQGDYKIVTKSDPQQIFGQSNRDKNTFYDTQVRYNPGPGAYELKGIVGKDGNSISISPRRPDTQPQADKDTPGPGTYDWSKFQFTLKSNGNTKIGSSTRNGMIIQSARDVPAPNQYSVVDPKLVLKNDPRTVFGSSKRAPLSSVTKYPGPGQYEIPQKAIEGRQFSLSGRYIKDKPKNTPGPDAYNNVVSIQFMNKKSPAFVFGSGPKSQKDLTTRRYVPGPGAYETLDKSNQGISFTQAPRSKERKSDIPGPGSYKIPVKFADVPKYLIPQQEENFKFV